MDFQAIILCCNDPQRLHPLTADGSSDCLLPLVTRPLLWYPLTALKTANVQSVLVVLREGSNSAQIKNWLNKESGIPHCEIVHASTDVTEAEALRACIERLSCSTVVVMSLGVVTDISIRALVGSHCMNANAGTVVLRKSNSSASAQTKAGKVPKGVDYIGLDRQKKRLLLFQSSLDASKTVRIHGSVLQHHNCIDITTDFVNSGVYVFARDALALFAENSAWTDIPSDLLPQLINNQFGDAFPAGNKEEMKDHARCRDSHSVSAFFPSEAEYLSVVCSSTTFSAITKELLSVHLRSSLVGLSESKQDSLIQANVQLGTKATVSGPCLVCNGTQIGENTTVKRSFIGRNCKIGAGCRVINSVVLDGVVIGDQCHVQSSIVAANCRINTSSEIKDSQIGPHCIVPEKSVLSEDVLPQPL